jgi:hypothetical protein
VLGALTMRRLPLVASLLAFLLAGIGTVSAQQFYKWTDAAGVTHYTDHPPENIKAKTVDVKDASGKVPPPPALPGSTPDTAKALDDAEAASRRRSCLTSQNNLKILQGADTVVDTHTEGRPSALTIERRRTATEQALKDIDTYCGAKP